MHKVEYAVKLATKHELLRLIIERVPLAVTPGIVAVWVIATGSIAITTYNYSLPTNLNTQLIHPLGTLIMRPFIV